MNHAEDTIEKRFSIQQYEFFFGKRIQRQNNGKKILEVNKKKPDNSVMENISTTAPTSRVFYFKIGIPPKDKKTKGKTFGVTQLQENVNVMTSLEWSHAIQLLCYRHPLSPYNEDPAKVTTLIDSLSKRFTADDQWKQSYYNLQRFFTKSNLQHDNVPNLMVWIAKECGLDIECKMFYSWDEYMYWCRQSDPIYQNEKIQEELKQQAFQEHTQAQDRSAPKNIQEKPNLTPFDIPMGDMDDFKVQFENSLDTYKKTFGVQ